MYIELIRTFFIIQNRQQRNLFLNIRGLADEFSQSFGRFLMGFWKQFWSNLIALSLFSDLCLRKRMSEPSRLGYYLLNIQGLADGSFSMISLAEDSFSFSFLSSSPLWRATDTSWKQYNYYHQITINTNITTITTNTTTMMFSTTTLR